MHTDLPGVGFDSELAKSETDSGGVSLLGAALGLAKFLEYARVLIWRNAGPVVTHRELHACFTGFDVQVDRAVGFRELEGVVDQVFENTPDDIGVAGNENRIGRDFTIQSAISEHGRKSMGGFARDLADVVRLHAQGHLAGFEPADIEQSRDHVAHVIGAALGLGDVFGFGGSELGGRHALEGVDVTSNDGER